MAEILELFDVDAGGWPAWAEQKVRQGRLHLVLGDSIARDANWSSRFQGDAFLNAARGGATWRSVRRHLSIDLAKWNAAVVRQGRRHGRVVLWLTGNDLYCRRTGQASWDQELLQSLSKAAEELVAALPKALVLGPLPRLGGEAGGAKWETTAAFHLERRLLHCLPTSARFVPMGRHLTIRRRGRQECPVACKPWFHADGVHLTKIGYQKLSDFLPIWLCMNAE